MLALSSRTPKTLNSTVITILHSSSTQKNLKPCKMLLRPPTATAKSPLSRHRQHGGHLSSSFFHSLSFPSGFSTSALLDSLTTSIDPKSIAITCEFKPTKSRRDVTVKFEKTPRAPWLSVYRRISSNPEKGAANVLNRYEDQGKTISKFAIVRVVKQLRKFGSYKLALEVFEWMENRRFLITTSEIAIKLDLISKVDGISSAENYYLKLSNSLKDGRVYGALLNAYAHASDMEKAEALFDKMKEQGYIKQALSCNVMMTLYMKAKDYDKVEALVSEMTEKNIPLDIYSYNIWLSSLGSQGSVEKMEQAFRRMKRDTSITLGWTVFSTMATIYIKVGQLEKAEDCLKQIETRIPGQRRLPYHFLIGFYGSIGKKEEVHRIWNVYKSSFLNIPAMTYRGVISSLVRLGDIEGAENTYDEWLSMNSTYDPRVGNTLLGYYVRNGLTEKADVFFNQMIATGIKPNSWTWGILADHHIKARRIPEALSCLKDAASFPKSKYWRPRPETVSCILQLCEQENDEASKELLFEVLKESGCLDDAEYMSICTGKNTGNELEIDDNTDEETNEGSELIFNQVQECP